MDVIDFVRKSWNDASFDVGYIQMAVLSGYPEYVCDEYDEEYGYPTQEGMRQACAFIARAENWTDFGWWLYKLWYFLRYTPQVLYLEGACGIYGHDWEDESWGGPESGGMAASCKRCGYSWSHTMY